ncbi:MAG: rubredoxin [Hungatella sp.]
MNKYVCMICGFTYDEAVGIPKAGIAAGTKWEDLPENWVCPLCGAAKSDFKKQEIPGAAASEALPTPEAEDELRELNMGELSALCSNLARGCEKQYLAEESALFTELSEYFKKMTPAQDPASYEALLDLVQRDLNQDMVHANTVAAAEADRGARRVLVWNEKVTRILNSILGRYQKEGDAFLEHTNVYVCETCGFLYIGEEPPALCPVCKVPSWKFTKVERR